MAESQPLIKQLASSNTTTRDRALRLILKSWLPTQPHLSDDDLLRLWKGLFYCVWHSDKLPVQSLLVNRLAALLPDVDAALSIHYFSAFLVTMRREWPGIDALRLDKFYLLIRRFLHYFFVVLKTNSWDSELTGRWMGVLAGKTLWSDDKFEGNGVNYHIGTVLLEELRPFLPLKSETLELLFNPFLYAMRGLPDKVLLWKLKSNMFDELLKMGRRLLEAKKSGGGVDSIDDDVMQLGTIAVVMGFSGRFYELGSSPECCQGNRKVLFGLHEEFLKLEKEVASLGIKISIPEVNVGGEDDEVPELVPIAPDTMEVGGGKDASNGLKKCKKAKKASSNVDRKDDDDVGKDATDGHASNGLKKCKEAKKSSDGSGKKSKKKKDSPPEGEDVATKENGGSLNEEQSVDENLITFNEFAIYNLQMQFEKVAADVESVNDIASACDLPKSVANGTSSKKRKRAKSVDRQQSEKQSEGDADGGKASKSVDKSAKKVRFSMKNNLVWKPNSPLPPQDLRIPPSVTPRGSALKKGVSPGPIRGVSTKTKSRANSVKKGRKKVIAPGFKHPKKLKSISA